GERTIEKYWLTRGREGSHHRSIERRLGAPADRSRDVCFWSFTALGAGTTAERFRSPLSKGGNRHGTEQVEDRTGTVSNRPTSRRGPGRFAVAIGGCGTAGQAVRAPHRAHGTERRLVGTRHLGRRQNALGERARAGPRRPPRPLRRSSHQADPLLDHFRNPEL